MGTNGSLPIGNWYPQPFGQYPLDQAFRQAFDDIYELRDHVQGLSAGGTGFWEQQGNLLFPQSLNSTVLIGSATDDNSGAILQVAGGIHSATGLLWGNEVNTDTTYDIQKTQVFRKDMANLQWSSDGKTWNNFSTVASPWTLSGSDVFPNSTSYKVLIGINTEDGSSAQLQVGGGANINTSIYMIGGVSSFRRSGGNLQWSPDGSSWNTFATTANPWTLSGTSLYPTSTSDIVLVGMTTTDQGLAAGSLTTLGSISAVSATANASLISIGVSPGNFVGLASAVTNTGTPLPLAFFMTGTEAMRILTTRNILINQTSDDGSGTAFTGNKWLEMHGSISLTGNSGGGYQARIWMDTDTSLGQSAGSPGVAGPGTDNTAIDNQGFEGNFFRVKSRLDYFDWTNWNVILASGPLAAHTLQLRDSSAGYLMNYSGTAATPPGTKGPSTGQFTFIGSVTTDITSTNGFQASIFRCNNGSDYFDWLTIGLGTHSFDIRDSGSNGIVKYRNPSANWFTGSFALRGLVFMGSDTDDGSGAQLQVRGINGNINASGTIQSYATGTNIALQVNSGTMAVLGNGLCGAANFNLASSGTYQIGGSSVFRVDTGSGNLQWSQNNGTTWNNFSASGGGGGWTESAGLLFPTNLSDKVLVNRNSDDGSGAPFQVNGTASISGPLHVINSTAAASATIGSWSDPTSDLLGVVNMTGSQAAIGVWRRTLSSHPVSAVAGDVWYLYSPDGTFHWWTTVNGDMMILDTSGNLTLTGIARAPGLLVNQANDGSGYLLQCNGGIEMAAADAFHNILSKGTAINAFAAPNGGMLLGLSSTDVTGSIVAASAISVVTASAFASVCGIGCAGGRSALFSSRSVTGGTFLPLCFDTSLAERMRIVPGGNVLIGGTTDNGQTLQVFGSFATWVGGVPKFGVDTAGNASIAGSYFNQGFQGVTESLATAISNGRQVRGGIITP